MSLDTLVHVKARLGINYSTDDALLDLLRETADAYIANYCGRDFEPDTHIEFHDGDVYAIHLRNYPIATVTDVRVDPSGSFWPETVLPATSYIVDIERGLIWSRCGPFVAREAGARAVRSVRVDYETTAPVPADVQHAYADLVGYWYRHVKTIIASRYQNVTQQTFGDTTAIFAKDQINGLPLPPDVVRLLAPYREAPL